MASTAPNLGPDGTCSRCGFVVGKDAPFGQCPRCVWEVIIVETPAPEPQCKSPAGRLQFGDYELIEQIGRGGMGVVYKARQVSLSRTVALKMVLDSHLASPVMLRRFLIEAEAAAKLDHPNIVPIYDVAEVDGHHFFSMRLIEGESLERKLKEYEVAKRGKTRLGARDKGQEKIATLIAAVARAVHYAHERGVLHRDLKPGNILIDPQGQPHLTDFGLAKLADKALALTPATAVVGTPGYMAPELALGGVSHAAADIYSIGAIFYELLTGELPFRGSSAMEILRRAEKEEPVNPRRKNGAIDADLATICLKCLEKKPTQRYVSARALAEDVERWLRRESIHARHTNIVRRTSRWVQRNPVGSALIAALVIGLAVSVALLVTVSRARTLAEYNRSVVLLQLNVDEFWKSDRPSTLVKSETMALLKSRSRAIETSQPRYRIGMLVEEKPLNRALRFADFLLYLEDSLSRNGRNVRFDYVMYKRNEEAIEDLVNHKLEFLRIGGLSYLDAHRRDSNIVVFATQIPAKKAVIFVRPESGIESLRDLEGRTFAFGDSYATISFWARFHLATNGIGASALKDYELLESTTAYEDALRRGQNYLEQDERLHSHFEALRSVLAGKHDAGVCSERQIRAALNRGTLRKVYSFQSSSLFWIAGSRVPAQDVNRLKSAMLTLTDKVVLENVGGENTRLREVPDGDFEELRRSIDIVRSAFPDTTSLPLHLRDEDPPGEEGKP